MALLISLFLLVLGISYLTVLNSDFNYLSQQERNSRCYYLARAGLEYYSQKNYVPTFGGVNSSPVLGVVNVANDESFSLSIQPRTVKEANTGNTVTYEMVVSKGMIRNGLGVVTSSRTLMAPKVGPALSFKNLQTGWGGATDHVGLDRGRISEIYDEGL